MINKILKPVSIAAILVCVLASSYACGEETTTWYVVRHADRDGDNDALTKAGHERAKVLADIMVALRVDAIYSTETVRTQSTAKPTAEAQKTTVHSYDDLNSRWFDKMKSQHRGKSVLIVAHSNTLPLVVEGFGGPDDIHIEENEFDRLVIITESERGTSYVQLRYGNK